MESIDATSHNTTRVIRSCEDRVAVLLAIPVDDLYEYSVPQGLSVKEGSIVSIPLGNRTSIGVVWGPSDNNLPIEKLRPIEKILDFPIIKKNLRDLVDWAASYTLSKRGAVLKMILNTSALKNSQKRQKFYRLTNKTPERMTKARKQVIESFTLEKLQSASEISRISGTSIAVINGLEKLGCLEAVMLPKPQLFEIPKPSTNLQNLSNSQRKAAENLIKSVQENSFSVTLLEGVTGSGKTEVYFEALVSAKSSGKQSLILLPEIALSTQWLTRFEERFGVKPGVWHSDISPHHRSATWRAAAEGTISIIVGARSALWLPFSDLGLIIVDEEHDPGFKQEEGVIYHARDMAVARGKIESAPVVLVSATPSLETLRNVKNGRYNYCYIPDRFGQAKMPQIEAIDMRQLNLPNNTWLSTPLREAIKKTLNNGCQAALFLNRRGYAPLTICRACGYRLECPNCSAWLVEHRSKNTLNCHHCGYIELRQNKCKKCGETGKLSPCGPGVERLAEEVKSLFPDAKIDIATSDTMVSPKIAENLINSIESLQTNIIIGTQVIAKGHHFPMLTLIGVVDADLGLIGTDLRAAEHTYQLLNQVSGRAGRAKHSGHVMLQTHMPEHPVMNALINGEREVFLREEAAAREKYFLPPYGRLVALIFSGTVEVNVLDTSRLFASIARSNMANNPEISILGPAPAFLSFLRGKYRYRVLIKGAQNCYLQKPIKTCLTKLGKTPGVRVQVDVDPHSFL